MNATFYTAYHAAAPLIQSASVKPIHVGRACADAPLPDMIGDDTGTHISERNSAYCELTAMYWAWKNDTTSTHLGLFHYRRLLDVENTNPAQVETFVPRFECDNWLPHLESWLEDNADIDMIVPRVHTMGRSMRENYITAHHPQDWDLTREIIAQQHPQDVAVFDSVAKGVRIHLGNMFLMRRPLFERYCAWLFGILEALEARDVDRQFYSPTQNRYLGYVAERLMTVWIEKLRREDPDLKIHEAGILNLSQALIMPWAQGTAFNGADEINVAFAADRTYLPHTAAMLASMLEHADPARRLNLFFLHSDILEHDRALLREVLSAHPRVQMQEINAGNAFESSYRSSSRAPSNTTYNRFLLFDLLPDLNRLLYVDVDMVFQGDVAQIWDTDLGGKPLGAVTDHIMTRTLTGPTLTVEKTVPDLYRYHRDHLGLSDDQIACYFNAGLLLFDFTAMDVPQTSADLMRMAREGQYMFRDQDIMNAYFKGRTHVLDPRYNVFNTVLSGYTRVPHENHAAAMAARAAPVVIHYAAGDYKPWNFAPVPMAEAYWKALIKTPFYGEVMLMAKFAKGSAVPLRYRNVAVRAGVALAERFPALKPMLMRTYARLRG